MIHSMAGGSIKNIEYNDYAKVEIIEKSNQIIWYKSKIKNLQIGDLVLVPFNNITVTGKILRIDKNVSDQIAPRILKNSNYIIKKLDTTNG